LQNCTINSLLDYQYTKEEHQKNLISFQKNAQKIESGFEFKIQNINKYYQGLILLYFLIEKYIESGIQNINVTIEEIIKENYNILLNLFFSSSTIELLTEELINIYDKKNWDYQNASEFQLRWSGIYSFKTTFEHKIIRIKSYYNGLSFKVKDEKVWDTIADLINYCYIYLIWSEKGFPKERNIKMIINKGDGE